MKIIFTNPSKIGYQQLISLILTLLLAASCSSQPNNDIVKRTSPDAVKGKITLLDLGSMHCQPCLMMMPVLDALKEKYAGRVEVKFIDVNKYPDKAQSLKVMTIPTQVIFDRNGQEVLRHIGFFPQDQLEKELDTFL